MGRKYKIIFGLAPMMLLYGWLIVGGMVHILVESLGYIPNLGFTALSLSAYSNLFQSDGFVINLFYALYIAIGATVIATTCGVLLAFYLITTKQKIITSVIQKVLRLGVILPYLYMIFLVMLTFSRSGLISRLLLGLGIIGGMENMPSILYNPFGLGMMLVFVAKGLPFVTLFTLNVMANINATYEDVAKILGCNPMRLLTKLYVPMSKDVIIWTSIVLLMYSFGSFEVPQLLSSLRPTTLSVQLYSSYLSPDLRLMPQTMALTMIMFLVGALLVVAYATILRRLLRGYRR